MLKMGSMRGAEECGREILMAKWTDFVKEIWGGWLCDREEHWMEESCSWGLIRHERTMVKSMKTHHTSQPLVQCKYTLASPQIFCKTISNSEFYVSLKTDSLRLFARPLRLIQALTSTIIVHVQSSYFIRFFNFLLNNNFVVLCLWLYSLAAV